MTKSANLIKYVGKKLCEYGFKIIISQTQTHGKNTEGIERRDEEIHAWTLL